MKVEELLESCINAKYGNFTDLELFNFMGVYIIYETETQIVVYIGSAYARTISKRLKQYLSSTDTGNTLGKSIAKALAGSETYDICAQGKIFEAVRKIKNDFSIIAIPHKDLEYKLIANANPIYNNNGKAED